MNTGVTETEQDPGKVQFQEELNRWFENRGIIADLRSHLRHLMITALQNTQLGLKPTSKTSPKVQALNLIMAEYLLRHGCHYTLSVFTSEVPTLTNFSCINPGTVWREKKCVGDSTKNRIRKYSFQVRIVSVTLEEEVEEIFNALGLSTRIEEFDHLKATYLGRSNECSLVELLLQMIQDLSAKLEIHKSLESYQEGDGERLLPKTWSSRIADTLLREKIKPSQVTDIEKAIYRITDNEMNRIIREERRSQLKVLFEREKRIQEYLRRHEEDIFVRLEEAEKDLAMRTGIIDEELSERQRHLCKLVTEWNNKHEEIVKLSKNFYNIEKENKDLQKIVKELETENKNLKGQEEKQNITIDELKNEMKSLISRLKEVTESNAILSERVKVLISRENKEVSVNHDQTKQEKSVDKTEPEIPLLWSKNKSSVNEKYSEETKTESKQIVQVKYYDNRSGNNNIKSPTDPLRGELIKLSYSSEDEKDASCHSSSSEEILLSTRKKVKDLEEESNRINQNYLEYKLKSWPFESDSEKLKTSSDDSLAINPLASVDKDILNNSQPNVLRESKFSQTERENKLVEVKKLEEKFKRDSYFSKLIATKKRLDEEPPSTSPLMLSKRQSQNRDYFLKSRQLLQKFEIENLELNTSPSNIESCPVSSSSLESPVVGFKQSKKSSNKSREDPVFLTPLRTTSFYCNEITNEKKDSKSESPAKVPLKSSNISLNCLALLEETRIKSPPSLKKKPLRQQILLAESEAEEENREKSEAIENLKSVKSPKSDMASHNDSGSSGKVSVGKSSGKSAFW